MASLPLTRNQLLAAAVGLAAVLLLASRLLLHSRPAQRAPAAAPIVASAAPPPLVVDVVGAVRRPGLYHLSGSSRIADAISRAGGATARAELDQVNLAAPLADGEQIVVPRRGAEGAAAASVAGAPSAPVQLSTATAEQLDTLPGIGPVTAQKIVDYRTQHGAFHSVEELDAIPGIGPARLEQLKGLVVP
jgi:competence protein ComEA